MWQKLLQLQFAPNPKEVLPWMLQQGVGTTITAYGGDPARASSAAREGAVAITRWTNSLRAAMQTAPRPRQADGRAAPCRLHRRLRPAVRACRHRPRPATRRPGRFPVVGQRRLRDTQPSVRRVPESGARLRPAACRAGR